MARERETREPWSQARPSRGSLRHARLLPLPRGHESWKGPTRLSICHDAPGKNTVKYCFFIPFMTLTRLHLEALLAPGSTVGTEWQDAARRVWGHPRAPGLSKVGDHSLCSPRSRGPRPLQGEMAEVGKAGPRGNVHSDSFMACTRSRKNRHCNDVKGPPRQTSLCWAACLGTQNQKSAVSKYKGL